MNTERSRSLTGPIVALGFTAAITLWCAWYFTHLPWLGLSGSVSTPLLLLCWLGACIWAGAAAPAKPPVVGMGAGVIAALVGLLLLGTKLATPSTGGDTSAGLRPGAGLMAAGFVGLGLMLGLIGGSIGGLFRRPQRDVDWLARFAIVVAVSVAPLMFIGGMVTSTDSGMAVPDWPNTYGSNMFLYPLGSASRPDVFLEHAHRLFGAMIGLETVVLTLWVLGADSRKWVRIVAVSALAIVIVQGLLGARRVLADFRLYAMIHGVLAQLTFGMVTALAVFLSPTFKRAQARPGEPVPGLRRVRFFTTGLLHSTILQLVVGAAYRHFRDPHSLYTHIGISILVVLAAAMAGFSGAALPDDGSGLGRVIRRCGAWLIVIVFVQFLLGWAAFSLGGSEVPARLPAQAVLRTAHQANGSLLLAVAVVAFFCTRRLIRLTNPAPGAPVRNG